MLEEAAAFKRARQREIAEARQMAAFFLVSGIDLATALTGNAAMLRSTIARLERLIERERLKGARRHWSYDLNRHIALKQALDRLRRQAGEPVARAAKKSGARRRRNVVCIPD